MLIAAAVTTAASVLYFAMGSSTLMALFTWRMLVAAARNHVYYLEFFATNPLYPTAAEGFTALLTLRITNQ